MGKRRITFDVSETVYNKLDNLFATDGTTVSGTLKAFVYNMTGEEMEMSATDRDRLDRIEESKKRLADKEARLKKSKGVPDNPFFADGQPTLPKQPQAQPQQTKPQAPQAPSAKPQQAKPVKPQQTRQNPMKPLPR